jgi:ribosomal protein S18 acetylase RimI-like enzyme
VVAGAIIDTESALRVRQASRAWRSGPNPNDQPECRSVVTRIRPAVLEDVEAVTQVHEVARRAYYEAGGISVPAEDPVARDEYHRFWLKMVTAEWSHAWVAEESARCIAFLVAGLPIHEDMSGKQALELIGLYVLPEAWGSGVADGLHERFVELLGSTPTAAEGVLDVWSGNRRAQSFYRRHGWVADGRSRPGLAGQPYLGLRLAFPG